MKKENIFLSQIEQFVVKKYGEEKASTIMKNAYARYEEICNENIDENKAMHIHTRERIYPGIACFDALILNGVSRDEASEVVIKYYEWRSTIMGAKLNKFMKLPGLYKFAPKLCRSMTNKMFNESAGFKSKNYDTDKKELRFDMQVCPYVDICKKYKCPEITVAYCNADDICFGGMHEKVIFIRNKTLSNGDNCCDFSIKLDK